MSKLCAQAPVRTGVLVVEDQTAIRELLVAYVGAMPTMQVVGEAGSVPEALRHAERTRPDVVVLDWMLLGGMGLDFLRQVHWEPAPRVLVFSANTTDLAVREAFDAGAQGYVEKTASFAEFQAALAAVAAGRTYVGPAIAGTVQRLAQAPTPPEGSTSLSPRERDVLRGVAAGRSSKEIADELGLSVRTIENHRARIMRRTGFRSTAELTLHAVRLGLVDAPASPGPVSTIKRPNASAGSDRDGRPVRPAGVSGRPVAVGPAGASRPNPLL